MKIEKTRYNACLAKYFSSLPLFFDEDMQKKPYIRKCVEQPWQQAMSHSQDIVNTLNNYDFIEAKLSIKLHKSLLNDFEIIHGKYEILDTNYKLILSNLSNLIKYPTQFINLLYHIGEERIKNQVKETIRQRPNKQTFLLSEIENYQKYASKESSDSPSFIILYRKEYYNSKLTFAIQKELLFGIKQIGNLSAIDVNKGDEFYVKIDMLPDIPEKIYISESGNYFLIAYPNEIALIYQFIYKQQGSNLFIEGEKIAPEIRFKLPEFDPPVFCFKGESLIYQNQAGEIVKTNLTKNVDKKINLGTLRCNDIELATINVNASYTVLGVRHFNNSQILITSDKEIIGSYKFDDIIQCSAFLNDNELIVCTLDKKLFHFKLSTKGLIKELLIELPEAPIDCVSGQNSIIVLLRPNQFFVYLPQKKLKPIEGIPDGIGILRILKFLKNNIFLIGTTNQFITFSLEDKTGYKPFEIVTINNRKDGSYLILLKESTQKILYDSKIKSLKTFDELTSSYINETFLSIDGEDNLLHLYLEGIGYLYNNKKREWTKIENISTDTTSLTGDSESGFWLSTKSGQIIFIDINGKLKIQQTISEEIINTGMIRVFKDTLVWNGIVLKSGEYGTDFKCQIRFYKIKRELFHTSLLPIRERIFADHNSLVDSICFNEFTDSFYIFLFSDKYDSNQLVRIGKVNDFWLGKEKVVPIEGLNQSVKYSNLEWPDGQCFIIGNQNGLFLIDMESFEVVSMLQPNIGFNKMALGHSSKKQILITDTNNQIYNINKISGGK